MDYIVTVKVRGDFKSPLQLETAVQALLTGPSGLAAQNIVATAKAVKPKAKAKGASL